MIRIRIRYQSTSTALKPKESYNRLQSNFIDYKRIKIQGGIGGNGISHFGREPFKAIAPPDGGNGGNGGRVWIRVVPSGRDLRNLNGRYAAKPGDHGSECYARGANGEDVVIDVPKGTVVQEYLPAILPKEWEGKEDVPHKKLCLDTSHPFMPVGTKFLVGLGGQGGFGNAHFRTSMHRSPEEYTEGDVGHIRYLSFELKSIADVGLVGLPNAGKSSFVRAVSRCRTQVGSWAFTTLHPYLGTVSFPALEDPFGESETEKNVMNQLDFTEDNSVIEVTKSTKTVYPPFSFTIADIPGIIRGAAGENRGIGHEFLRHIEKCSLLAYVIDLSREEPWKDLKLLVNELETYRKGTSADKRGLVICNKADVEGTQEKYQEILQKYPTWEIIPVSSKYERNTMKALWKMREVVAEERMKLQRMYEDYERDQMEKYGEIVDVPWMDGIEGVYQVLKS